jgi:hypothetical protein
MPPDIRQKYNEALLSMPTPKLGHSLETFDYMWREIERLWHKLDSTPKRKRRCEVLKKEIFQLYERAKAKEKERQAEKDHKTQGFMYSVYGDSRMAQDVYERLRFGRKDGAFWCKLRENGSPRKVQNRK